MKVDDRALTALAESIADGTAVDWANAESAADAGARHLRLIRHLRLVESIAALHRSIPADETPAPTGQPTTPPDGRRWGRLVLLETIGTGTSCEVFRAWDSELHREVALKLLHDDGSDAHERVLEEARRLARLRHAHVVQVYGAEQHDGRVGLWMELVRGTSLEEMVNERGPLGPREAALIGLDVCAALAAVHGAGLLHRDVKAQNVMREQGGRTVLTDFGTGEALSGTNRLVGTPLYLAPELFRGQRASVQSDLYSVGVLLFYLVTGKFPVVAGTMQELALVHSRRERQLLRDLRPDAPEPFVRVVERALDSDPIRRYRSIGELESALRESLDLPQAREERAATTTTAARGAWQNWPFLAAGAALLALVFALIVWTRTASPPGVDSSTTRVAVLPFRTVSASSASPFLGDELTDQLISTLGQIQSLQVTSLSSVLPFKDHRQTIPEMGQALHVDNVVEATLAVFDGKDGQRVRINARLIRAGTDSTIWSQSFERSLGDTLALQAEVARAITNGIRATLTPEEKKRLEITPATTPQANDAYFEGLHALSQSSSDGQRAVTAFRRAIELDPNHAGAHAGLARGLVTLGFLGSSTQQEARALASAETRRAIELDPESSEAYAVLADLQFYYDWNWSGAEQSYRQAIALNPSSSRARAQYARYLSAAGRAEDAIREATQAAALDPMSASAASTKAMVLYYARDYEAALAAVRQAIQLEPASASAYFVLSRIESARSAVDQAIAANERALEISGDGAATSWRAHLIRLRAQAGPVADGRVAFAKLLRELSARKQMIRPVQIAFVEEALGDPAAALAALEKAADQRDSDLLWLGADPRADSLRSDPRLTQVLTRVGVPR